MEGDHAPNVIAGSHAFGARTFDIENARKYMVQSGFDAASKCNDKIELLKQSRGLHEARLRPVA